MVGNMFVCNDLVVTMDIILWRSGYSTPTALIFFFPCGFKNRIPLHLWSFGLMERREAFRFHTPSSLLVVGPSGCGKTVFTTNLLLNNLELFHTRPSRIHYCYGVWQDGFQPMKERGVRKGNFPSIPL